MPSLSFDRITRSFAVVAIVLASLAACGGEGALNIPNNWTLQSANDHQLPDTVPHSSPVIVVTGGTATIADNGNYSLTVTGTSDGTAGTVASDHGTWTVASSTLVFHSASLGNNGTYVAALTGNNFRLSYPGSLIHSTDVTVIMSFSSTQ